MIRNIYDNNSLKTSIRERYLSIMRSISRNSITYVDELYTNLYRRINQLCVPYFPFIFQTKRFDITKFKELNKYAVTTSDMVHRLVPNMFSDLSNLVDTMYSDIDDLNRKYDMINKLASEAEVAIKTKQNLVSIKDEIVIFSDFYNTNYLIHGNLTVDRNLGYSTLKINSVDSVKYNINNIAINKDRGKILDINDTMSTEELYSNGYFFNRMFSYNPVFENEDDGNYESLLDDDLDTSFIVEYNSDKDDELLSMKIDINVDNKRVDNINLILDIQDSNYVTTPSTSYPTVTSINIQSKDISYNYIDTLKNDKLIVNKTAYSRDKTVIPHNSMSMFPTVNYPINFNGCSSIVLDISTKSPQTIIYPEKNLLNREGTIIDRFNYFETLILNNYEASSGRLNPRSFYSNKHLNLITSKYRNSAASEDIPKELYRYYISIKELILTKNNYAAESYGISSNLNNTSRKIGAVELFTDQYGDYSSFSYYISSDKNTWLPISPTNHPIPGIKRYIFNKFIDYTPPNETYRDIDTADVYLKVELKRGNDIEIPFLKSFAVRIKFI
jgi:hypothetical protein